MEAVRYFADPDVALAHMVELRWPEGVHCPTCGRTDVRFIKTRRLWECKEKHARRQFSAKVGTIFEDSAIPLDKWFVAIRMVANCKNGISSYDMARALGITQKRAWHMNHRIRLVMKLGTIEKITGECKADETFIGGLAKNMHPARRAKALTATGKFDKTAVMGILERSRGVNPSRVPARVIPDTTSATLRASSATTSSGAPPSTPIRGAPSGGFASIAMRWSITAWNMSAVPSIPTASRTSVAPEAVAEGHLYQRRAVSPWPVR
ncbi:MAG TPA: IS1595 family transposase [Allosphingosinicella sp.]|jgi:transposase-like protein